MRFGRGPYGEKQLGDWGEEIASIYLEQLGYTIHARRYRLGRLEADLIASRSDCLVVFEIKTRRGPYSPDWEYAFRGKQRPHLHAVLRYYAARIGWKDECALHGLLLYVRPPFLRLEHIVGI